ncbi:carbon-nitrogen hydrolase family protein [Pontivivens ytuae]|uniref:Carbon-nitrogen hydrolase family protein n=1 Tax=Pontivivens ytuae TaxID=2789856 RepID=A0A7S9QF47_9RHOB|nr:carbon-nitrogen hydrolase family protein [Pontivivens ytuae]QPH56137.1 carbon-nitrogen hydrolase family protein [Pontivivens ytuae]
MRAALVQLTSSDDPAANLPITEAFVRQAAAGGATLIATPEVTNCVSLSRKRQEEMLRTEADDPTLARLREVAAELDITLLIGSLAVKNDNESRFSNRSILIGPDGAIRATYDKIHMFDAAVDAENTYRESKGYRPGEAAVTVEAAGATLGMTVCYDMRFPPLYTQLAEAGAQILTVPSAFTVPTGRAHWEVLLRARAIETGCFVLAPAQCGTHGGSGRKTWGHSLAISPWGEVLADGGEAPGVTFVDLDLDAVAKARRAIPALANRRAFRPPSRA